MFSKSVRSYSVSIFIAGDYQKALAVCQDYCDTNSYCVTVTPTEYVYKNGKEPGVIIGLINYPRFPAAGPEIYFKAVELGKKLLNELNQQSFSVETPDNTVWFSNREEDLTKLRKDDETRITA